MTETCVSLYKESFTLIEEFLRSNKLPYSHLICEGLVAVVNLISDYHEEGIALNPEILLIKDDSLFPTLPDQQHIAFCTEEINDKSFSMAIKMCAPLAENGWKIYLQLINDSRFQYGVINASLTQMGVSLFNHVTNTPQETSNCAYIRNIGNKVVELSSLSHHCTIALNLNSYEVKQDEALLELSHFILRDIEESYSIKNVAIFYIKDMLISALNHGHGNLIAVTNDVETLKAGEYFSGGIFLSEGINFPKLLQDNDRYKTDNTATTLNAFTHLTESMLIFDGITLFDTNGNVVGYHLIVNNKIEEDKTIVGGSRTRAFEALSRIDSICACLMKSQDGNIKYHPR